jgi:hypothetical protein
MRIYTLTEEMTMAQGNEIDSNSQNDINLTKFITSIIRKAHCYIILHSI